MSARDSVKIVKRGYEAFQKGDIETLLALLTDDVEWETLAVEGVPWAGPRRGKADVRDFFGVLAEHEEMLGFEPREFIAQGEKVAVVGHYRGRIKATGQIAETPWVQVFTIRDGKLARFFEVFDTASAARAYQGTGAATG